MPIARRYLQTNDQQHKSHNSHQSHGSHRQDDTVATPPQSFRPDGEGETERRDYSSRMHNRWDSGREELIKRIKKEQRPSWLQTADESSPPRGQLYNQQSLQSAEQKQLLPSPEFSKNSKFGENNSTEHVQLAASIARPRSALHSGDFRDAPNDIQPINENNDVLLPLSERSNDSWWKTVKPFNRFNDQAQKSLAEEQQDAMPTFKLNIPTTPQLRNRAASYSAESSAFVFIPPTSPLALQSNSADFNKQEDGTERRSRSPDKASRRRTFSPNAIRHDAHLVQSPGSSFRWPVPSLRSEKTFPYQAHQPRRSLSSFYSLNTPSPTQTPSARTRRPSISSDASPLQRAPMVGRYEESILRGRMSTVPSKPFDFVAQIGVMGKGKCRSSLRCPPHVIIPFPAVFYNYGNARSSSTDGPSPYVGMVDIQNFETTPDGEMDGLQNNHGRSNDARSDEDQASGLGFNGDARSKSHRKKVNGLRKPPGGSYRIPQQGQIQVVIKNPNKTAVKLFLVPYDLSGMEPGQKTFIRQRSYSAGPIIEMPISSRKNLGTDRPEVAISNSDDPNDRPILRYLIHLQICCTGKGRFYLYKSMRIVFANRVPDGKEKLRSETQLPEPRFSTYKPEKRRCTNGQRNSDSFPTGELNQLSTLQPPAFTGFASSLFSFDETKHVPTGPSGPISGSLRKTRIPSGQNELSLPMTRSTTMPNQASEDVIMQDPSPHLHSSMEWYPEQFLSERYDESSYLFERRNRETYSSSSNGSKHHSPQPEGLITRQFRGRAG